MNGYCMQCSATAHTVNLSVATLEEVFWPSVYN
jgi:predicted anti-sigma-YlaC factor YlaD